MKIGSGSQEWVGEIFIPSLWVSRLTSALKMSGRGNLIASLKHPNVTVKGPNVGL